MCFELGHNIVWDFIVLVCVLEESYGSAQHR
jgi:hypothetical protein